MLRALAWAHSCGSAAQLWWGPRRQTPKCRKCAQSTPTLLGSTGRGRGRLVSEGHGRFSLLFYRRSFFQGGFFPQPRNRGPHDQVAGLTHCDTPCPCKGTLNTWNCPQATDIPPPLPRSPGTQGPFSLPLTRRLGALAKNLQRLTALSTAAWPPQLLMSAVSSWNDKPACTPEGGSTEGLEHVAWGGAGPTCAPLSAVPALGSAVPAPPAPAAPAPSALAQTGVSHPEPSFALPPSSALPPSATPHAKAVQALSWGPPLPLQPIPNPGLGRYQFWDLCPIGIKPKGLPLSAGVANKMEHIV